MRDTSSIVSVVPQPSGTKPDWVRATRSATAFWTPTAGALALTLVLVLCWPHKQRPALQSRNMPEATASYVLLEGSYAALPDNPLHNPWPGPGGAILPDREDAPARRLPAPEYTGWGVISPWAPLPRSARSNTVPNLADRPVANVLTGRAPATSSGFTETLSPGLLRCGFQFEIPPGVATNLPADASFYVELDDQGNVVHLLAEPGENPAGTRLLETAISRGHGTRAGRGQVLVSWGK